MKNKILAALLLLALTTAACEPTTEITIQPTEITTTSETTTTTTSAPTTTVSPEVIEEDLMTAFETLLEPEYTPADLADFIVQNIEDASASEADTMLSWLLIYQTDLIEALDERIFTDPYALALNETMGGTLDPEKIEDIEDPNVQQDFASVVNGYMTIVRYEETYVVESDWVRLSEFSPYCSNAFGDLLRLSGTAAVPDETSLYAYCADIVHVEKLLEDLNRGFLRGWLSARHRTMVNTALAGTDGSYLDTFVTKEGPMYDALKEFAYAYPVSGLGQLIMDIDSKTWTETDTPRDMVRQYLYFSYGSPYAWEPSAALVGENTVDLLVLTSEPATVVTDKINDHILGSFSEVASTLDWPGYHGTTTTGYGAGNYISVFFSMSDQSNPDEINYIDWIYTYDLNTGEPITVADYLNMTEARALSVINDLKGTSFEMLPDFEIFKNGITLRAQKEDPSEVRYVTLTLKDLMPYVEEEQLYR